MRNAYKTPEMKEVALRRRTDLLGCSSSDGDLTPCIEGPIAMDHRDDSHNG
jgi:hypothetical protein